jgi:AcrR family transcriptional regulator
MAEPTTEGMRSERKRRHILASATAIFSAEGFSQAGMEHIARDAGVSTATLYAYFPSKAELFRIVVEDVLADLSGEVHASVGVEGDARTRLTAFASAYAAFYSDATSRALFRMIVSERKRFPDLAEHFRLRGVNEFGGGAIRIVRELAEAGAINVEKPAWAAGQLQGMIEHATLVLGLINGDDALPARPLDVIAQDAVETFLARYGAP